MKSSIICCGFLAALLIPATLRAVDGVTLGWPVDKYDVAWDSPSQDAKGSMPLGNGDIGLNVWVEPNGDLILLVAKSDSFDEFNRLLKIGRIRIKTTPALVQPGKPFAQILRLSDGLVDLKTAIGAVRIWVDANHPLAQVDVESTEPVAVCATLEDWRTERRALTSGGGHFSEPDSMWGNWPDKMRVNPDTTFPAKKGQIASCHHNEESQWKRNLELTGLASEIAKGEDPILDRTFGAVVRAAGTAAVSGTELQTEKPVTSYSLQIVSLTRKAASPDEWLAAATSQADSVESLPGSERLSKHKAWWHTFWNRSWIDIEDDHRVANPLTYVGPLQVGHDPTGGSRFAGQITGAITTSSVLTGTEIAQLAATPPGDNLTISSTAADISLTGRFTAAAWIKPAPGEGGRIFDKSTPGGADGLLFDTYPGLSLRLGIGDRVIRCQNVLKPNVWQHVAATFDAATGAQKLYLDGKLLESKTGIELSETASVSRAYALQRFVSACAGRGALPIKFNGSIFTVEGHDPDFRAWGGGYWWQNTRLMYWPMLYSGDYDMMLPLFAMYRNALPLREAATKIYYKHEGAFFPETMHFWGNYLDQNYGFDRKGKPDGLVDNPYIRYHWQGGLELVAMMLDYYDATQDAAFRDQTLLPIARDIVTFYDQHWPRGADGKINMDPSQALETWWVTKNPLPEVAGLHYVIPRLIALPVDSATKAHWEKVLADLPPVPTISEKDGVRLLPAETFGHLGNIENPEMYGVFPYRIYTDLASQEDEQIGLATWRQRRHQEDVGWHQNIIQAAMLGLSKQAKPMAVRRAAATASGYRFPGFFGPNYDWTPEVEQASNLMTALQRMLMQCEGDRIVLLPAWPVGWNSSFKLHAPHNTTVQGRVKDGRFTDLIVTPESRRKDVEVPSQAR